VNAHPDVREVTVCIPVTIDGRTDRRWGRASRVAVAAVSDGRITDWREIEVGWDVEHDQGSEGSHHARVARFLRDQQVQAVVAGHMGDGMTRMLATMGIRTVLGADGDARDAVVGAISTLDTPPRA
jgi:predicted Fe-Mo cluster-binding NifX family protein